jgi:sugar lactone lactonase YvrE
MTNAGLRRYALTIGATAAFLAGCSAPPLPDGPGGMSPLGRLAHRVKLATSSEPVIYVADQSYSEVIAYSETTGQPIREISDGIDGPYGLYVDKNGTLYVANESGDTVTAYPAGSTSPSATWSENLDNPHYPIVDASGNLFVSNQGNGTVVEYRVGSTNAYEVLETEGTQTDGMDFDAQGNLYVAFRTGDNRRQGGIEEFAPGETRGTVLPMRPNSPQGIIVDSSGKIMVVKTGTAHCVALFSNSSKKFASQRVPAPYGTTMTQLAIEANQSEIFASTLGGSIYSIPYPFPASRKWSLLFTVSGYSTVQGIAISNGQTF